MRYLSLAWGLVPALALFGCGSEPADGPVGAWVVDRDSMGTFLALILEARKGEELRPEDRVQIEVAKAGANVTLLIKADGTWTGSGTMMENKVDDAGTWTLDGENMVMTLTKKGGEPASRTTLAEFKDGALTIKLLDDGPFSVRMIRK